MWLDLNWPQMTGYCVHVSLDENAPSRTSATAFPNPFTDRLTLLGLPSGERVRIDLMDASGRVLHSSEDLVPESRALVWPAPKGLPSGTYLLRVSGTVGVRILSIVKQ